MGVIDGQAGEDYAAHQTAPSRFADRKAVTFVSTIAEWRSASRSVSVQLLSRNANCLPVAAVGNINDYGHVVALPVSHTVILHGSREMSRFRLHVGEFADQSTSRTVSTSLMIALARM